MKPTDLLKVVTKNLGFRNILHFKNFIEKACKDYIHLEEVLNSEPLTKTEKDIMRKIIMDYFIEYY